VEPVPVEPKAAAAPSTPPPKPAPGAATPVLKGFVVQVGAFRDEAKLGQARDKLAAAKVVHYTKRLDAQGGALTRLRAGPFPTRDAAEAAQATLKRAGLDGKVVPLP
jgi:DedD protein